MAVYEANQNNRNGDVNPHVNAGGVVPVAHECTYQDFMKCQQLNFKGTEGVVGLTRWFKKMETVFHIRNFLKKYQVNYALCTLQDSALTWWNSHKWTIGTDAAYAMTWKALMKLMTKVEDWKVVPSLVGITGVEGHLRITSHLRILLFVKLFYGYVFYGFFPFVFNIDRRVTAADLLWNNTDNNTFFSSSKAKRSHDDAFDADDDDFKAVFSSPSAFAHHASILKGGPCGVKASLRREE
ncbi:hypothetical protein Tco_0958226 [Tanacetum coccineum]